MLGDQIAVFHNARIPRNTWDLMWSKEANGTRLALDGDLAPLKTAHLSIDVKQAFVRRKPLEQAQMAV